MCYAIANIVTADRNSSSRLKCFLNDTRRTEVSSRNFVACRHDKGKWMIFELGSVAYYFCRGNAKQAPNRFASAVKVIDLF